MSLQKITFEPVSASQPAPAPAIRPLIMLADDSPTVRKIVEVSLRRAGYEVVSASDGVEALRFLLTVLEGHRSDPTALPPGQVSAAQVGMRLPDLILLDIEMPRLDGYTLALQIRKRPQLAPLALVMLSRRNGIVDRLKARLAGVRVYLSKPFTEQELHALVAAMVGPARINQDDFPQPGRSATPGCI